MSQLHRAATTCAIARDRRSTSRCAASLAVAAAILGIVGVRANLQVNFTPSLPIGLYRRVSGIPSRGDLVVACLPKHASEFARARGYLWRGDCPGGAAPVGKVVLAVAGDTVSLTRDGFVLNGIAVPSSRMVARDSRGRPIPHYPFGCYLVRAGEVWLFSPFHPLSFDSRYLGPVPASAVRSRIAPVWTSPGRS